MFTWVWNWISLLPTLPTQQIQIGYVKVKGWRGLYSTFQCIRYCEPQHVFCLWKPLLYLPECKLDSVFNHRVELSTRDYCSEYELIHPTNPPTTWTAEHACASTRHHERRKERKRKERTKSCNPWRNPLKIFGTTSKAVYSGPIKIS